MVYFTCQHCGESVNKPRVVKHYETKCRFRTPYLTCVDCLKDFHDQEYNAHTSCITEAQRYSAKGTVIKEAMGKKKQAKYIEVVQSLLSSKKLTCVQRDLLEVCASYDNVPRKLKKFQNFMNNVAKNVRHTKKDEEDVFRFLESAWKSENQEQTKTSETKQNSDEKRVDEKTEISNNCKTEDESISNNLNTNDSILNTITESKKTKIKKHKVETVVDEKMEVECNSNSQESKKSKNGLTKKQLKKQQKYEKYLMELQTEVQNDENENEEVQNEEVSSSSGEGLKKTKKKSKKLKTLTKGLENGLNNQNTETSKTTELVEETKQKKSKKLKMNNVINGQVDEASAEICKESLENLTEFNNTNKKKSKKSKRKQTNLELNGIMETENSIENIISGTNPKKNKKRKMEDAVMETTWETKKARIAEDEAGNANQTTFDWTSVILRVLESRPDKELSIKRLGKKVIDEYQTVRPDHRTYEELLAKFNKKVKKTQGVRVLKDKAKLVK